MRALATFAIAVRKQKWTYTDRRGPGRPRTIQVITQLIIRMALENRSWGYTRIQGALGEYCGHGLLHGQGPHAARLSYILHSFCARLGEPDKIAGITAHPHEAWMVQMARNLTDAEKPSFGTRGS